MIITYTQVSGGGSLRTIDWGHLSSFFSITQIGAKSLTFYAIQMVFMNGG